MFRNLFYIFIFFTVIAGFNCTRPDNEKTGMTNVNPAGSEETLYDLPIHENILPESENLSIEGFLPNICPYKIQTSGKYAYLIDKMKLLILDVSDSAKPKPMGYFFKLYEPSSLAVNGNYIYITERGREFYDNISYYDAAKRYKAGIRIIDISDPLHPEEAGYYYVPGIAEKIMIKNNYAYVAVRKNGLIILDLSDPVSPVKAGCYEIDGTLNTYLMDLHDNYLCINGGNSDFDGKLIYIIDIKDPGNPELVLKFENSEKFNAIDLYKNYLLISETFKISIIDFSNEGNIGKKTFCSDNSIGIINEMVISGNIAYIVNNNLLMLDISDMQNPIKINEYKLPVTAQDITINGNYAYIADFIRGMRIIDISVPVSSYEAGFYDTPSRGNILVMSNDYAYIADNILYIMNINDTKNPCTKKCFETAPVYSKDLYISGEHVFLTGVNDLLILNASDIENPVKKYSEGFNIWMYGMIYCCKIVGSRMYFLIDGFSTFYIVILDISNPTSPKHLSTYELGFTWSLDVSGNYLYLNKGNKLEILDISDLSNFKNVYEFVNSNIKNLKVCDKTVFLLTGEGLVILDVTDNYNPKLINRSSAIEGENIVVSGSNAFISSNSFLYKLDISDLADPKITGRFNSGGDMNGYIVYNNKIFALDKYLGLWVLDN